MIGLQEIDIKTKQFCFLEADCLVVGAVLGVRPENTL